MALSEDQRAMLQLLLERGQSYGDIGSLLGLDVEEVRRRARSALTEMGGEDPDREVALTDYLLGQADPIGRADAARHLQADPQANALAQKLVAQLRLLAPGAELPSLPGAKGPAPAATPAPAAPAAPSGQPAAPAEPGAARGGGLSSSQRRLIAALIGGAALVALIVLLVAGVFSGGGDDNGGSASTSSASTSSGSTDNGQTTANAGTLTKAILQPEGGGSGSGVAIFGRVRNVPVLEVRAVNLDPSPQGTNYSIWLFRNDKVALRVGGVKVDKSGRILTQIPVPTQALGFVANGTFDSIVVTLTDDKEFAAEVAAAKKAKRLPKLTGDIVLKGEISGPAVQQAGAGSGSSSGGGAGGSSGGGSSGG